MVEFEGWLSALGVAAVAAPAVWIWWAATGNADLGVEPDPRLIFEIARAGRLPPRHPGADDGRLPQPA